MPHEISGWSTREGIFYLNTVFNKFSLFLDCKAFGKVRVHKCDLWILFCTEIILWSKGVKECSSQEHTCTKNTFLFDLLFLHILRNTEICAARWEAMGECSRSAVADNRGLLEKPFWALVRLKFVWISAVRDIPAESQGSRNPSQRVSLGAAQSRHFNSWKHKRIRFTEPEKPHFEHMSDALLIGSSLLLSK